MTTIDLACVCACDCGNVLPDEDAYVISFGICDDCDYCGPRHGCDHPTHPHYRPNWPQQEESPVNTLTYVALPAMLKCALMPAHEVTHPATPIKPEPIRPLKDEVLERVLANYRESARRGINYAWGHGWDNPVRKPMRQTPHRDPLPKREVKPLALLSPNGKRLPLRALDYREVNRQFWSQGKVVNADVLERAQARELASLRDPAEMSLDELIATQNSPLMSESRRSFLTAGVGTLSLEGYGEGSIGEMLAAEGVTEVELDDDPNHDALRYGRQGTATVDSLDPITAKQIDWEKAQFFTSDVIAYARTPEGKFINKSPRVVDAKSLKDLIVRTAGRLLADPGSDAPLQKRADLLTRDQISMLARRFDRYVQGEIDRAMSLDDDIMHGSYEYTVFDDAGNEVTMVAQHRPYRRYEAHFGKGDIVKRCSASDEEHRFGPWKGVTFDYDDFSIGSDDEAEAENLIGSEPCPECHEGVIPAHSNVLDGEYAGLTFCTAECGAAIYRTRQTAFDLIFGRFNEEVA